MDKVTALENHVETATAHHIAVLFICMLGMLFNIVMLAIFCTRKKVRGSVYTTYMIQIAITDLLVCVVWLVMTSMYLHALPTSQQVHSTLESGVKADVPAVKQSVTMHRKNLSVYRFTYAMYNFHYYNNIFLLATMSIERCVAVWKSLRCQRYQFNRKFIYVVSVLMWLLAFACALPSFVNPDLITQGEQDMWLKDLNKTSHQTSKLADKNPSNALLDCYEPLRYAIENNHSVVKDHGGVSVLECLQLMQDYSYRYDDTLEEKLIGENWNDTNISSNETTIDEKDNDFYEPPSDFYPEPYAVDDDNKNDTSENGTFTMDVLWYSEFLHMTGRLMEKVVRSKDIDNVCDPRLSKQAKDYQIIVNLVIGFFAPFIAILTTNLGIAFMIGNRARHRLESDNGEDVREDSTMRRMSDFLRQFGSRSESKTEGEVAGLYKKSPVVRKKGWQSRKQDFRSKEQAQLLDGQKNNNDEATTLNLQPTTQPTLPDQEQAVKTRGTRPRLSSFSTQIHRTSGGSASSAESFPTDLTSLHTTSPSPGVRLTAPSFLHGDSRVPVQRACSADSSTTGSGGSHGHRRWSSEVFKPSNFDDDKKTKNENNNELELSNIRQDGRKIGSSLHSRGVNATEETAQLVSGTTGSHTRLYAPKPKGATRQISNQSIGKGKGSSLSSKASRGRGGTTRKTPVFKNAERQMRVSKSVLAYVLVFTICWLPQRITTIIYVTEGLVGKGGNFCHVILFMTRMISFFSVLLNPIVYAFTQREVRNYIRQTVHRVCKCICPQKWLRQNTQKKPKTPPRAGVPHHAGMSANENGNYSAIVLNNPTTDEETRRERHARNRKRWSDLRQRLGRKSSRFSASVSRVSAQGNKQSDDTIDEEREEDKAPSSKGPSSTSFKMVNGVGDWDDWQKMVAMASENTAEGLSSTGEAIL